MIGSCLNLPNFLENQIFIYKSWNAILILTTFSKSLLFQKPLINVLIHGNCIVIINIFNLFIILKEFKVIPNYSFKSDNNAYSTMIYNLVFSMISWIQRAVVLQIKLWFATYTPTSTVKLGHHDLYNDENF